MENRDGFIGSIGNTPLIRLRKASELTGCTILGKAEFLNPGGSVKDRAALYIILEAEKRGALNPGGVIVEGTAGNTGGTLAGVSMFLKEKRRAIRTAAADPMGAAMYHWIKHRELKSEGDSITEGIGLGRVTRNIAGALIDDAYQVPDSEALPLLFDLLKEEGLCLGGSSGINVAGAIRLARDLGPGHTVVTILADSGTRYQSKLFNPAFLKEKGLPCPDWL